MSTLLVETRRSDLRAAFANVPNAVLTLTAAIVAGAALFPFVRWALIDARWRGTAMDCRAPGVGACWAFIGHKLPFILFGLYPPGERWRSSLAMLWAFHRTEGSASLTLTHVVVLGLPAAIGGAAGRLAV